MPTDAVYFLHNADISGYLNLNKNELRNVRLQNLSTDPSSPVAGQVYYNTSSGTLYLWDGSNWITFYETTTPLNLITAPTGNLSMGGHKVTSLGTPTAGTDACTKAYADALQAGLSWKTAARAATTANITLSGAQTIDGVSVVAGDRVLVKNQSTASENGVYLCAAGAWTRTEDADSGAELVNAAVFVSEGTTNADTGWVQTANGTITVGSTSLMWVQFTGTQITAGDALTLTGSTLDVAVDGTTIEVNADALRVKPGVYARRYDGTISGDGSTTSFTVTHNFGTKRVAVNIVGTSAPYADTPVLVPYSTATNSITVVFGTAPAAGVNFDVSVFAV